ncbi:MAG: sugar ABC transporter ATP-binding protein [Gemmatimonadaceae bacterium]
MSASALSCQGITKYFPGVVALDAVTMHVGAGTVHAICGENGAGKSTLGRILAGIHQPDAGEMFVDDRAARFASPRDALAAGIAMVHQELAFCDNLTVAENLCLGALPSRRGFLRRDEMRRRATEMLSAIGAVSLDPRRLIGSLSVAEQQLVQIAAAVGSGARIIIFDEPTSSLGSVESTRLFALIADLRARGVTMLYVSHRMAEIFELSDAITVLRDGRHVRTCATHDTDEQRVVHDMIGRSVEQYFPAHLAAAPGEAVLEVRRLSSPGRFHDVAFTLRRGEVLGLAGLVGAGRSEIAQAIFGLDPRAIGSISVRGEPVRIGTPREAMRLGIALVPEDRKRQGLVLAMRGRENVSLPTLPALSRWSWIDRQRERASVLEHTGSLRLSESAMELPAFALSGGNQQKLVMARWLAAHSDVLLLDEPTRGVDVGAKAELHAWIDREAASGKGVLLISSELPELLSLSTRIIVLRDGRVAGELARAGATQERLVRLMAGLAA